MSSWLGVVEKVKDLSKRFAADSFLDGLFRCWEETMICNKNILVELAKIELSISVVIVYVVSADVVLKWILSVAGVHEHIKLV